MSKSENVNFSPLNPQADFRGSQAGLGSQPGMKRLPNESYKEAGKRMLYQRYQ